MTPEALNQYGRDRAGDLHLPGGRGRHPVVLTMLARYRGVDVSRGDGPTRQARRQVAEAHPD